MSIRVGVIGLGRMGKLHCRVLSEMPETELACVVDTDADVAETVAGKFNTPAVSAAEAVELVDAVVVATPTCDHVVAARPFIAAGKAVLVEKPIADNIAAAEELIDLAKQTGSSIQVGHTERFNPAVEAIRRFDITPKFIEAHRISPFTFRSADIGVVLDMMIHDIDLVLMLAGGDEPEQVEAVGVNVIGATEDIANARLTFLNGCVANLTASRLAIKSERKMRIFSEQAYLSVDYGRKVGLVVKKSENLDLIQMARKMNAKNMSELAGKLDYTELIKIEQLEVSDDVEPLRKQAEAFYNCVANGADPVVPATAGLAAIRCAAAITESIKSHRWDGSASERQGPDIIQ